MGAKVLLSRAAMAVRAMAMKDSSRGLDVVQVAPLGKGQVAVATDGHSLAAAADRARKGIEGPAHYVVDAIEVVAKLAGPPKKAVGAEVEGGRVSVGEASVPMVEQPAERFAQWQHVVPRGAPTTSVEFDVLKLERAIKVAKEWHQAAGPREGTLRVELHAREEGDPLEMRAKGGDGQDLLVLVMPMRDFGRKGPKWTPFLGEGDL